MPLLPANGIGDSAIFCDDSASHYMDIQQQASCASLHTAVSQFHSPTSATDSIICPTCHRPVENSSLLKSSDLAKHYPCSGCKSSFVLIDNLIVHRLLTHQLVPNQDSYDCPLCEKYFSRFAAFKSHLLFHQIDEDLLCRQCHQLMDPEFCSKPQSSDTYSVFDHEMQYRCNICGMMLSSVGKIKQHYRRRHPNFKSQSKSLNRCDTYTEESVNTGVRGSKTRALRNLTKLIKSAARKPKILNSIYDSLIKELSSEHPPMYESETSNVQADALTTVSKKSKRTNHVCSVCKKSFSKPCLLKRHMSIHTKEKPFMCILCQARFTQKSSAKTHLSLHMASGQTVLSVYPNPAQTGSDNFAKPASQNFAGHLLMDVSYIQVRQSANPSTTFNEWQNNPNLSSEFVGNSSNPEIAISYPDSLTVVPNFSSTNLILSNQLSEHPTNHSLNSHAFLCSICTKKFSSSRTLSIHMRRHLSQSTENFNPSYSVSMTNPPFESRLYLDNQTTLIQDSNSKFANLCYSIQNPKGPHHCPKCSSSFQSLRKLKFHILHQCNNSLFSCHKCARRFVTRVGLEKHYFIRHRTSKRQNKCFICHESFPSLSSLGHHMNLHSNERLFSCFVCHKRFKFLSTCRRHIRTHSTLEFDSWDRTNEFQTIKPCQKSKATKLKSGIYPTEDIPKPADSMSPIIVDLDRNTWLQTVSASNFDTLEPCNDPGQFRNILDPCTAIESMTTAAPDNHQPKQIQSVFIVPDDKVCHLQGVPIYVIDPELSNQCVNYTENPMLIDKDFQSLLVDNKTTQQCVFIDSSYLDPNEVWNTGDFYPNPEPLMQTVAGTEAIASNSELRESNIVGLLESDVSIRELTYHDLVLPETTACMIPDNFNSDNHQSLDSNNIDTFPEATIRDMPNVSKLDETMGVCDDALEIIQVKSPVVEGSELYMKKHTGYLDSEINIQIELGKESDKFSCQNISFFGCGRCQHNYRNPEQLNAHYHASHSYLPKPFRCTHCPRAFTSETLLIVHKRSHDSNSKDNLSCPSCPGTNFTNRSALTRHILYCHPMPVPEPFRCTQCGSRFRMLRSLKVHVKNMLDGVGKCKSTIVTTYGSEHSDSTLAYNGTEDKHPIPIPLLDSSLVNQIAKLQPSDKLTLSEKYLIKAATEKVEHIVTLPKKFLPDSKQKTLSNSNLSRSCPKCGRIFSRPSGLRSHMSMHMPDRFKCDLCNRTFIKRLHLLKHISAAHNSDSQNFRALKCKPKLACHLCGISCASQSSLRMHVRLHTGTRRYQCPRCLAVFHNPSHRKRHLSKCCASRWNSSRSITRVKTLSQSVTVCKSPPTDKHEDSKKQQSFVEQLNEALPDNPGLVCLNNTDSLADAAQDSSSTFDICHYLDSNLQFFDSSQTKSNYCIHPLVGNQKISTEQILSVDLDTIPTENQHSELSFSDLPILHEKANNSMSSFDQVSEIQTMSQMNKESSTTDDYFTNVGECQLTDDLFQELFQCTSCFQVFTSNSLYSSHTCLKLSFKQPSTAKRNSKRCNRDSYSSSSLQKIFKCSTCKKTFGKRPTLIRHERIHHKDRPFICKVCGLGFTQSFSLTSHELIHNNVKPYQCPHCDASFRQRCNLQRHIKSVHS